MRRRSPSKCCDSLVSTCCRPVSRGGSWTCSSKAKASSLGGLLSWTLNPRPSDLCHAPYSDKKLLSLPIMIRRHCACSNGGILSCSRALGTTKPSASSLYRVQVSSCLRWARATTLIGSRNVLHEPVDVSRIPWMRPARTMCEAMEPPYRSPGARPQSSASYIHPLSGGAKGGPGRSEGATYNAFAPGAESSRAVVSALVARMGQRPNRVGARGIISLLFPSGGLISARSSCGVIAGSVKLW